LPSSAAWSAAVSSVPYVTVAAATVVCAASRSSTWVAPTMPWITLPRLSRGGRMMIP